MEPTAAAQELEELLREVRAEAASAPFPIDEEVYHTANRDPLQPILCAGNLNAPFCIVGRDLGREEVKLAQPQVGAAGRRVRTALLEAAGMSPQPQDRYLEAALELALLTNLAPYKPPGNKTYSVAVRERFRPFLERLLVNYWQGEQLLTLGTEAFQWFSRYAEPAAAQTLWASADRYQQELPCVLSATVAGVTTTRALRVAPLPHPSPLNQTWFSKFPELMLGHLRRSRSN